MSKQLLVGLKKKEDTGILNRKYWRTNFCRKCRLVVHVYNDIYIIYYILATKT